MPKLEKNKKNPLPHPPTPTAKKTQKKTIFQKMKLSCPPKKTNKTSLKFIPSKSLIKTFYTLDKTPKGETGF